MVAWRSIVELKKKLLIVIHRLDDLVAEDEQIVSNN